MKAMKYLAMAAAALAFAACSNEELASTQNNKNGLKPLEFSTIVQKQTRAQIYGENLATLYMQTTGNFYDENNVLVTNPTLTLTKSGDEWTYTYNNNTEPSYLYWPNEGTNATFKAWYYEGGSAAGAFNDKTAEKDAVGAYTAINYVSGEQTVSLSMYHAVAKAEFKVKVLEKEEGNDKVKIDVKRVCLHNMNYQASAYTMPTSEAQMGAFTVDGNTHRDLLTPLGDTQSFITEGANAVNKGSLFVLPQTFTVQDLTETTWSKPYISVLAQICIDEDGDNDPVVYPKNGTATDYAWIALPLPSEFTGMVAHKKYVFTINFRNDALGKVDRDQNPNGEDGNHQGGEPDETGDDEEEEPSGPNTNDNVPDGDEGSDIHLPNHSGFPLVVTVEEVYDFDEDGDYNVSNNTSAGGGEGAPMLSTALTFEATVDETIVNFINDGNAPTVALEYSIDGGATWPTFTSYITLAKAGDKVMFRAAENTTNTTFSNTTFGGWHFWCNKQCYVYGNIMSLINQTNFASATELPEGSVNTFAGLFKENNNLISHATKKIVLPATTLTPYCCSRMFNYCTGLTTAPIQMSAMTMAEGSCAFMFNNCSNLTTAPALPATTMGIECYNYMFYGTKLTTAPDLPATTMAERCYVYMFMNCSNLTTAPAQLPATDLTGANECYYMMFKGCESLTKAPELLAVTMSNQCCVSMFEDCTSLTEVPAFHSTTLAELCYAGMFRRCTALETVPADMLPATTLAGACYEAMFDGCTSLTASPVLAAPELLPNSYGAMFSGCSSLSSITCLATSRASSGYLSTDTYWWYGSTAPVSGTFYINPTLDPSTQTFWIREGDGKNTDIPTTWVIKRYGD